MKQFHIILAALAGGFLLTNSAHSQTVATDPVGFIQPFVVTPGQPNMLANSDTYVSLPFTRPPEFVGATTAATTNTLTVSGTPWTANQFVYVAGTQPKTYFVLIGPHASSNPKEGRSYQITSNTASTLTVNANGDDLSSVAANTQILVIPYATFNSVFPATDVGVSFTSSPNPAVRPTQVFIPNYSATGVNLAAAFTYYYFNGAWRRTDRPSTEDRGDDAFVNGGYFIVRNTSTPTTLTILGSVLTKKNTIPLITRTSGAQDNFVSLVRPIDLALNDLGLITSGAFLASPNLAVRTDQLFVYDNTQQAINKASSATYFYYNNAWRKVGQDGSPDAGADMIPAGAGFIIRKAQTATGAPAYWTNAPTY